MLQLSRVWWWASSVAPHTNREPWMLPSREKLTGQPQNMTDRRFIAPPSKFLFTFFFFLKDLPFPTHKITICSSCTKATWTLRRPLWLGHVWRFPTSAFTFCILHQSREVLIGTPTVPQPCAVLRFWNTSPIPNPTRPVSQVTRVRCGDVWNSFRTWKLFCNCSALVLHSAGLGSPWACNLHETATCAH